MSTKYFSAGNTSDACSSSLRYINFYYIILDVYDYTDEIKLRDVKRKQNADKVDWVKFKGFMTK